MADTRVRKSRVPQPPRQPTNPGDLFIWREPFEPRVLLEPNRPSGRSRATVNRAAGRTGAVGRKKAFFLGVNLLGDFLCTTPVIRSFRRQNPNSFITYVVHNATYCRALDDNPDIDLVVYNEDLYWHGEKVFSQDWFRRLPVDIDEPSVLYRFNIHEVCRSDPKVFEDHISWGYARFLQIPIESVRPVVTLTPRDRALAESICRRPFIVFAMHGTSKVLGVNDELTVKNWVFERWLRLARHIHSWKDFDIIAVGSEKDQQIESRYIRNLYGLPIKVMAALLERAACVVTVEGGISHLCHAVDAPMVVIFSKFVAFNWAFPREASRCRVIYEDPRSISCDHVIAEVESCVFGDGGAPRR